MKEILTILMRRKYEYNKCFLVKLIKGEWKSDFRKEQIIISWLDIWSCKISFYSNKKKKKSVFCIWYILHFLIEISLSFGNVFFFHHKCERPF